MEGLEKGRKKQTQPMRLEDLKDFKIERKAHSLSSASTEEGSPAPESPQSTDAPKKTNVDHAVEQVLLAHKEGRDVQAVYEHQDQALTSEEAKEFNSRLSEQSSISGIEVIGHATAAPSQEKERTIRDASETIVAHSEPRESGTEGAKSDRKRRRDISPYKDGERESAQEHLRARVAALSLEPDHSSRLEKSIAAAKKPVRILQLNEELKRLEHIALAKKKAEEKPQPAKQTISEPIEITREKPKEASAKQADSAESPHPERAVAEKRQARAARGTAKKKGYREKRGPHIVKRGDSLYVRDGNGVRTASAEEVTAHEKLEKILHERAEGGAARSESAAVDPVRDSLKADMYEATGVTHEELLRRLDTRHGRGGGSGGEPPNTGEARGEGAEPEKFDWSVRGHDEFRGIKPPTVRELLANEEDQLYFGTLVESLYPGGAELKRKMFENEGLSAEERKVLNFARYEYERRMRQVEFIQSRIAASDIEVAARRDEDFDAAVGLGGSERTAEVFKRQIRHLGMQNRGMLDRLQVTYENLGHLREDADYKDWKNSIERLCNKAGTTLDDYDHVFKLGSPEDRIESRRRLQEDIRGRFGKFRRVVDNITGGSTRTAARLVHTADMLTTFDTVRKVDDAMGDLTGMLRYTLVENPEVIRMLEQEAERNENLSPAMENGPRTLPAAKEAGARNEKHLDERLDAHVKNFKMKDGRGWDRMRPDERRESLAPLRSGIARDELNTGQGWFSRALLCIYRALFARKEEEFINKPVVT